MATSPKKIFTPLRALLAGIALAGVALALWHNHGGAHAAGHAHGHGHYDAAARSLNNGKRWETDVPLRTGMQRIRDAASPVLTASAKGRLAPREAKAMSVSIQESVSHLVANCKLPPKADATLHVLITDLMTGAGLLTENPASAEGASLIARALRQYAEYFDHPGWIAVSPSVPTS